MEALLFTLAVIMSACSPTRVEEEPYEWVISPTIRFVTEDFKYPKSVFTVGDTITIGCSRSMIITDPLIESGNRYAKLTTAHGDTESVDTFDQYFSAHLTMDHIDSGVKIPSKRSSLVTPENGILDIRAFIEPITVIFQPFNYKPGYSGKPLILKDSAVVVR